MEEQYFIASLQIFYQSPTIAKLRAELYDFSDNLLQTVQLYNSKKAQLPIESQLRNFYFRIINTDTQISELFSYFWAEGEAKEQTVTLTESYDNFIIKIQITIRKKQGQEQPLRQPSIPALEDIDARQHLLRIKQKIFQTLQSQNFFLPENSRNKCQFIRKNKTYKNLTALLIKNSSNILKKINQNMQCSTAKTYNNFKTTETNQTADEIPLEIVPAVHKPKKINSLQDPFTSQGKGDFREKSQMKAYKKDEAPRHEKKPSVHENKKPRLNKKPSLILRGKREYQWVLEKQTQIDLKNQKETLSIIHSYIAENVCTEDEKAVCGQQSRKIKENAFRKSRATVLKRSKAK